MSWIITLKDGTTIECKNVVTGPVTTNAHIKNSIRGIRSELIVSITPKLNP